MKKLTHIDSSGKASMVDVSGKAATKRRAVATATVRMSLEAFQQVKGNRTAKGDVLAVARIAGITGAKKTSEIIPLCHQIRLTHISVEFDLLENENAIEVRSDVRTTDKTGVEMEALTAVSVAALTIYDMCKAIDKSITISKICLLEKTGGKSGEFKRSQ